MGVFVVIPLKPNKELEKKLEAFDNKALRLPSGEWLVAFDGTSKQLCDSVGISVVGASPTLVVAMNAFWGLADPSIWEFVALHGERHGG